MTVIPLNCWSESDERAIREQLTRVLQSRPFRKSRRLQRFLEYVVIETLAGRSEKLKAYALALAVFDRSQAFDPVIDPIVRIEAGRLRDKLREYYEIDGQMDPIRIDLPKGAYAPHIEFRVVSSPETPVTNAPQPAAPAQQEPLAEPIAPDSPKFGSRSLLLATVAMLLVTAAGYWGLKTFHSATPPSDKPSIAVFPFDNYDDDPKWGRFADGITEDIIADLSHSRDLVVIARNSTEVYKGKPIDVREAGRDLGVKYILEGSIQAMGERVRVTAQLIETASGRHVWSERYDRPVDDIFAVQNDVTQRIAATLTGYEGAVAEAERSLLRRKPPANLTAFDTYLLAMQAKHKVTKDSLHEAERLFGKALELDPRLARAYVGLVDVQFYLIDLGLAPSVEAALAKQMDAAKKAVEIDPDDGKTHLALATAYASQRKSEQALAELDRAEALAPSDADLLLVIAWSLPQFDQTGRALGLAERALKLNPHYPDWYNQGLSLVYFFGEQYDKSVKYRLFVKEPLALDYAFEAMANAYLGRASDAQAAAQNATSLDPTWIAERYLSDAGGYPTKEAELFVEGARRAGIPACIPAATIQESPNLIRVKSCDAQRASPED